MSEEMVTPDTDALNAAASDLADALQALSEIRDLVAAHIYDADGNDANPHHTALLWLVKVSIPDVIGRIMPMRDYKTWDGDIPF
jgi:hypothetical protein